MTDDLEFSSVFDLLKFSDDDSAAVMSFLAHLGCSSLEDIALIHDGDFDNFHQQPPLSRMVQRKILLTAEFLQSGGDLSKVGSMTQLLQTVKQGKSSQSGQENQNDNSSSVDENTVVNLDVGGHRFTTTQKTMCRVPGSVLEAMFSGRHDIHPNLRNKDGDYVIDRNGTHFCYILDFLRVGSVVTLPSDKSSQKELAIEADYYGLDELIRAIKMPKVDIDEYLEDEVILFREDEAKLRKAFCTRASADLFSTTAAADLDPHRGLVSLFSPDTPITMPLTYEPAPKDGGLVHVMILREEVKHGTPVTVKSLDQFQSNFNRQHANVLHRLRDVLIEEPVVVAGGSVLQAITNGNGIRTGTWWGEKSDIDLFVHSATPEEAVRISRRIFYSLAVDNERWVIIRSRGVITIHRWSDGNWGGHRVDQKVQIVLRLYESPAEVLLGFDCDCCCCAYDGRYVWVMPRWLYAIQLGFNTLNPLHAWPIKPSYELRLAKYAHRGFSVVIPGLDTKRIDYDRIRQTLLGNLRGLARLLKVSFAMDSRESIFHGLRLPQYVGSLRDQVRQDYDPAQQLVLGQGGYDDEIQNVIIPSVYGQDLGVHGMMWYEYVGGNEVDFPPARVARDGAWAEIESAPQSNPAVPNVPALLVDSWDQEKRSREYLNAEMEKIDLDNLYYAHAYVADDA